MENTSTQPGIVFTDAAAHKALELILEERNPDLKLRVYIQGGGCSGFQYGFSFDEVAEEGDLSFTNEGVTLLVDPMSFQYLAGAEVDYTESLQGAQFVIRNPNASTCTRLGNRNASHGHSLNCCHGLGRALAASLSAARPRYKTEDG